MNASFWVKEEFEPSCVVFSVLSSFLNNWTVIYVAMRNWYGDKANFFQTSCARYILFIANISSGYSARGFLEVNAPDR